ncbi:hypothetical protein [Scytonema sp. NUACC26]|uniref:hypothetical protein n=1 Tax=Scytonema sp. NUACC26 TaxID=3140176 RepID=UPI0034DC1BF0
MAIIYGTSGNDSGLIGTELADEIYGLEGNDTLTGGAGNDYLEGGLGNDTLTGGAGKDTFVLYYSGGGIDTLTDYTVGTDSISITSARNRPSIVSDVNGVTVDSTQSTTDLLTFGYFAPPPNYLRYDAATGALSYLTQTNHWDQIAQLPTGLNWNQLKNDIDGNPSV